MEPCAPKILKRVAAETSYAGKRSQKTYNFSQARPRHLSHTTYIFPYVTTLFVITKEASLIRPTNTVLEAGHASETHRMASPTRLSKQRKRKDLKKDFDRSIQSNFSKLYLMVFVVVGRDEDEAG